MSDNYGYVIQCQYPLGDILPGDIVVSYSCLYDNKTFPVWKRLERLELSGLFRPAGFIANTPGTAFVVQRQGSNVFVLSSVGMGWTRASDIRLLWRYKQEA